MISKRLLAERYRMLAIGDVICAARALLSAAGHMLSAASMGVSARWDEASEMEDEHGVNAPGGVA